VLVVVTLAMRAEFASWRRLRSFRQSVNGSVPTYCAHVRDVGVRVVLTGVGQLAATAAAEAIFHDRPDACIASGLAGGLNEGLRVAEIIAGAAVRGDDGRSVEGDPRLLALALREGASSASIYSSPAVVVRAAGKRRLREVGDAVDMESAAILGESARRGIPGIAIRAISDSSTVDLPLDFNKMLTDRGRFSPARTIAVVARRPQAVPQLVRLGLDGRRAAMALTAFLDHYVERLGEALGRAKQIDRGGKGQEP